MPRLLLALVVWCTALPLAAAAASSPEPASGPAWQQAEAIPDGRSEEVRRHQLRLVLSKVAIGILGLAAWLAATGGRGDAARRLRIAASATAVALLIAVWSGRAAIAGYLPGLEQSELHGLMPFGAAVTAVGIWLARVLSRPPVDPEGTAPARRSVLRVLCLTGALTWINFGWFTGMAPIHYHDTFHYYMGSKYFHENRYDQLYAAVAVAEYEDGYGPELEQRRFRDLRTNILVPAAQIAERRDQVHACFTAERWAAFRQDVRLFSSFFPPSQWTTVFHDHGYNATPVWNMVGSLLANLGWRSQIPPPGMEFSRVNVSPRPHAEQQAVIESFKVDRSRFRRRLLLLTSIDYVAFTVIFVLLGWTFGLPTAAAGLLLWGIGRPWEFAWFGGALGRSPWLLCAVIGVCLLRRGWPIVAGFALSWSALLRLFPAALTGGVLVKIVANLIRRRTVQPPHRRLLLGLCLAPVVLVPLSLPLCDGFAGWSQFVANTIKHGGTPFSNHMGLATVFTWHPDDTYEKTALADQDDASLVWRQRRHENLERRKPWYAAVVLGIFILFVVAALRLADWEATALSTVLIASLVELGSYYFAFILLLVPVAVGSRWRTVVLLGTAILTQPVHYLFPETRAGRGDEAHVLMSLMCMAAMVFILVHRLLEARRSPVITPDATPSS